MKLNPMTPETASGNAQQTLTNIKQAFGRVPNVYGNMAHSPGVLAGHLEFDSKIKAGSLDAALVEKIALCVSAMNGCEYCQRAHFVVGKMSGIDADEMKKNLVGKSGNKKDQLALNIAREIVANKGKLTTELVHTVADQFSLEQLVDIYAVTMNTIFTNYFNHYANTEIDFPEIP